MWCIGANVLVGYCALLLMSFTVEVALRWSIAALAAMYQTSRRHVSKDLNSVMAAVRILNLISIISPNVTNMLIVLTAVIFR
jgi:Na+-translocating ferredoxin:NAD+ oxidoreductase RnfE subunit